MQSFQVFFLMLWTSFSVWANPLQTIPNQGLQLLDTTDVANSLNVNISTALTAKGKLYVTCDESGEDLDIVDCKQGIEYLPFKSGQWRFAQRVLGQPSITTMPLPYRTMGDNGKCYVEPILEQGANEAHASPIQIRYSAEEIIAKCTAGGRLKGGVAHNIGGDNNLAVVLGAYANTISCRGQFKPWQSCRGLLEEIPASKDEVVFGVDVALPRKEQSSDGQCLLQIFSATGKTTSSWYEVWEGAMALFAKCATEGKGGSVRGIGKDGGMFITMVHNM